MNILVTFVKYIYLEFYFHLNLKDRASFDKRKNLRDYSIRYTQSSQLIVQEGSILRQFSINRAALLSFWLVYELDTDRDTPLLRVILG